MYSEKASFGYNTRIGLVRATRVPTGELQREGVMRLATAQDEILPLRDPRVKENPPFAAIIILSNVVTRIGKLENINTQNISGLYSQDFEFLQNLYNTINQTGEMAMPTKCPKCGHGFDVEINRLGEP